MDKKRFLEILTTTFQIKENGRGDAYNSIVKGGSSATFKYFNEGEARLAAKYLRDYPIFYYDHDLETMLNIDYFKKIENYTDETREVVWEYHRYFHQYVGPFFYINGKVHMFRTDIACGNIKDHFINSPVSHFDYFNFLGIDGDYGNYQRGRVIYNNFTNEFYIYVDKSLKKNKDVIETIMLQCNLRSSNTKIKTDEHYTHDNLL